jgi:hypothetical protein
MSVKKRQFKSVVVQHWQSVLFVVLFLIALGALFGIRFGIAPVVVSDELLVANIGTTTILQNPLYLHQQVLQKLLLLGGVDLVTAVRATSVVNAVIGVGALFMVLKMWISWRMAVFGTTLFVSSSWLLHIARIGTIDANYLLISVPLLGLVLLNANKYSLRGTLMLLTSSIILLYIPGMVWFMVPVLIWRRRLLLQTFKNLSIWARGAIALYMLLGAIPIIVGSIVSPQVLLASAGLPQTTSELSSIPAQFMDGLLAIFSVQQSPQPLFTIATLPFISIATFLLVVLGAAQLYEDRKLARSKVVAGCLILGLTLHAVSLGAVSLAITLPFIYILASAGLSYLLHKWKAVFPRNPLAEKVGVLCIVLVVSVIAATELNRYFVAWPHSDGYHAIFSQTTP